MTLCVRGSWEINAKGAQGPDLPPAKDSKEVILSSLDFSNLIKATLELKSHINAQLTIWKDTFEGKLETGDVEGEIEHEEAEEEEED